MAEAAAARRLAAPPGRCSAWLAGPAASTWRLGAAGRLQPGSSRPTSPPSATCASSWSRSSPVAIVALGMALVIGTEGIDLSVGSVMAIAAAAAPALPRLRPLAGDRRSRCSPAGRSGWSTAPWSPSSGCSRSSPPSACWWPAGARPGPRRRAGSTELFDPTLPAIGTDRGRRDPDHRAAGRGRAPCSSGWSCGAPPSAGSWSPIGGNRARQRARRAAGAAHADRPST